MRLPKLKRILQWAVLARPRRGGRALPTEFAFGDAFLHGIEQVLDDELGWKAPRIRGDATPRGRRLWWWPYKEFINMVRRAAWTALAVRRAVPANRPPDDRFHR